MDLISRKMAIEEFEDMVTSVSVYGESAEARYATNARLRFIEKLNSIPTVPAVPLEPLAKWIFENLDPRCDCNYCFNEDTDFEDRECCNCPKMSEEQVKEALEKWMEEQ